MSTTRKFFKSGWRIEFATTYVDYTSPSIFERYVSVNAPIVVRLKDNQYSIDSSSIELYINGWDATEACVVTAISGGYQIRYIPTVNWYWNHRITIRVEASNTEGTNMASYRYYFDVVPRKIGDLIEEAIMEISQQTDWNAL